MSKIGFVARTRTAFDRAGRAVRTVVAGERAASFGRQAKKHLRALKRRLGWSDEDTFEDEEESRQRRRAQQMIGLANQRASSQPGLDTYAAEAQPEAGAPDPSIRADVYAAGDEQTAPMLEVVGPGTDPTGPMSPLSVPADEETAPMAVVADPMTRKE